MIQAYLGGNELKMFPDTAIGLTIQNFNISDISNRKIDRTNVIRVPKAGNEIVFDFAALPNDPGGIAYGDYDFDMIIDGIFIYENGRAFITGEDENSYTLNITNNKNIIDLLKSISLADLYSGDTVTLVNTTTWKNLFATKTNGFKIDFLYDPDVIPPTDSFSFATAHNYVSIYIDTILAKIAADYDITFSGDLLTDADFVQMRIPCVTSNLKRDYYGATDIYIDDLIIHDSLTAWDLIKTVLQLFCGVFKIDGIDMEMQKFNDLDVTTPIDWSGKLVKKSKKFSIPNAAQKNYILHGVGENVDKQFLSGLIECNNKNIDFEKDIATMKDKLFPYRDMEPYYTNASSSPILGISLPELDSEFPGLLGDPTPSRIKGLKDLVIHVDSSEYLGQPLSLAVIYWFEYNVGPSQWRGEPLIGDLTSDADTTIVKYYNPTANYSLVETMLTNPVMYDAELNLNIIDIHDFDHFKAVKIDELEGLFYVNTISNFLATSPGTPTRVELIKIS